MTGDSNNIPGQAAGDAVTSTSDTVMGEGEGTRSDSTWLKFAKDAHEQSTNFFDTNYRKHWEDDLRMFNSKHPRDSKYLSDAYKYRSRYFRPKSRAMVRKNEATAAMAFFSNPDVLTVDAVNSGSDEGIAGAILMKEVMQARLEKSIPWFLTVCGGFQDALNVGIVASLNWWEYRTKPTTQEVRATFGDTEIKVKLDSEEVMVDRPCIDLLPVGNLKFHPAAKWTDVVGTSPYLILEFPMYIRDILSRMEKEDGPDAWRSLSKATILTARIHKDDSLESARDNYQEDPKKAPSPINEYDMAMVHLNFIKVEDECYAYWTLKDKYLLSDPKPVGEVFLHCKDGRPPVTVGFCVLETHKAIKSSAIHLGSELQRESNEIANQRGDNVKFVLNKRWKVRRGANVDVESIVRNVPGGVTMVNDVDKDMQAVEWNDVTQSAYAEQDRLNYDYDSVTGNIDQASVQPNMPAEQPVGTMRQMAEGANIVTEYQLRTYVETWVEPTLRQLAKMEAAYETDEVILAVAGQKASQQFPKFGMGPGMDRLLSQDLVLSINVGMGSTDPNTRFQRFMAALGAYGQVATQGSPDMNLPEVRKELFGLAGFRDNKRFFTNVDPRLQQAQQLMQQAQQIAEKVVAAAKDRVQRREIQLNRKESDLKLKELAGGGDIAKSQAEMQLKQQGQLFDMNIEGAKAKQDMNITQAKAEQDMQLEREKAALDAQIAEFEAEVQAELARYKAHVDAQVARSRPQPQQRADG